jgi:hypothetical protein
MSKHTPGPWKVESRGYKYIVSKSGDGYITRDVCRMDASTMAAFAQEANARLITAAPDLLEALRDMVDHGDATAFAKARAAIAKAEAQP